MAAHMATTVSMDQPTPLATPFSIGTRAQTYVTAPTGLPAPSRNNSDSMSDEKKDPVPDRHNSDSTLDKKKDTIPENFGARRESTAYDLLQNIEITNPAHPIFWPSWKKWLITIIYCLLQIFVTLTSTTYVSAEFLVQEKFGGSTQVITLGQSMFIVGNAIGPAFLGPLSDIGGRKWVYVGSIFVYAMLNIGSALSYSLPMLIVFQFVCGAAGSTALSNVAGTIADLFGDTDGAGQPMALFVAAANIGPSLGSPVGEWIADNPHMGLNWIFWINVIIGGAFSLGMVFIPETLPRIVISREVKRRGSVSPDEVALVETKVNVLSEMRFVTTMALKIMFTEPIVICLVSRALFLPSKSAQTMHTSIPPSSSAIDLQLTTLSQTRRSTTAGPMASYSST